MDFVQCYVNGIQIGSGLSDRCRGIIVSDFDDFENAKDMFQTYFNAHLHRLNGV